MWSKIIELANELVSIVFVVDKLIFDRLFVDFLMFPLEDHNAYEYDEETEKSATNDANENSLNRVCDIRWITNSTHQL